MTEECYLFELATLVNCSYTEPTEDRTGVGTFRQPFRRLMWDLSKSFPLLTTKQVPFSVFKELSWFLRGDTNIKTLGCGIWNEWADANGDLGPVYGAQWRGKCGHKVDQIARLIHGIQEAPFSRRHIVTAWSMEDLPSMALPPCHTLFQCYISKDGKLSLQVYQRSGDIFLGVPFNMASYGALCHLIAHQCGYAVGKLSIVFGDLHLYANHVDAAMEQLNRDKREPAQFDCSWLDYDLTDPLKTPSGDELALCVAGYNPHPRIKAQIAV